MGQVAAFFSGIAAIKRAVVPRSLGIEPNTIVLYCQPQSSPLPANGTLTIAHGSDFVTMPDVQVDWAATMLSTRGHKMAVKLLDRRWRWKYSPISGRYNVRLADGTIDPATEKTPQELAVLLFQAMHEIGFDVTALPDEGRPEVDWTYDRADVILAQMCEDRGCDISLGLTNQASIVRLGVGALLPFDGDVMSPSITADPPEGPDILILVCGETQYESRLKLKAVGLDTDGQVKAINDLSYAPTDGWSLVADENFFEQLRQLGKSEEAIRLAKKTVYRWYQIDLQSDGTLNVPEYGLLDEITQILPLNDYLLDTYTVSGGTKKTNKPYEVLGKFVVLTDPPDDTSSDDIEVYDGDSYLDRANGIVKFPRRMVQFVNADGNVGAAELYLQTSYGVRSNETRQQERHVVERNITGGGVLKQAVRIEELAIAVRAEYDSDETTVSGTTTNESEVTDQANSLLDALQNRFTLGIYGSLTYRGIKAIQTDGAIRQVAWYVGDGHMGAKTVASRNSEVAIGPIRSFERRRRRLIEANADVGPRSIQNARARAKGAYR